jgi:hypothetical protein
MARLSARRVAQVCIGILLLVIVRSLGEYFRLRYLYGDALLIGQVTPQVAGALFAAVALALALACYLAGLYRVTWGDGGWSRQGHPAVLT